MAYTQADLDALRAARASGASTVRFADRRVEYRGLDEMDRIILSIEKELAGTSAKPRTTYASFSKG